MNPGALFGIFAFVAAGVAAYALYAKKKASESSGSQPAAGTIQSKFRLPKVPTPLPTKSLTTVAPPDIRLQPGSSADLSGLLGGGLPGLTQPEGAGEVGSTTSYDPSISEAADRWGVQPNILKAIVARESDFNQTAINPEKSFVLNGKRYSAGDANGRAALRAYILGGGDPLGLGINPSIGLAQVRVTTARKVLNKPTLKAADLFVPDTNLDAAARLLKQLFDAGITLDTIDAYNVGQDLSPRNLPYRDFVKAKAAQFAADF